MCTPQRIRLKCKALTMIRLELLASNQRHARKMQLFKSASRNRAAFAPLALPRGTCHLTSIGMAATPASMFASFAKAVSKPFSASRKPSSGINVTSISSTPDAERTPLSERASAAATGSSISVSTAMDALTTAPGAAPHAPSEPQLDAAASLALYEADYERKAASAGADDPATLTALRALAKQCTVVGAHSRAVDLWAQAAAASVRVDGYSDRTLDVLYDYAEAMLKGGRVQSAVSAFASLRSHVEGSRGGLHPRALKCVGGHGLALHMAGRHAEAADAFKHVLAHTDVLWQSESGSSRREALSMANALANVLWRSGRLKDAEEMHFKIMLERTSLLGSDDLDTLRSVHNLAAVLSDSRRFVEAEALQRRVYESFSRQLPKDHPEYLNAAHNLACTLAQRGRPAEAQVVYEAILAARRACQGAAHPETLMTLHNLAITIMAQGPRGRAKAEAMLREALPGYLGALGPTHELTLVTQRTLALALIARGSIGEAEAILKRVCLDAEAALGMSHPACVDATLSLADLHVLHTKKYAEASALLQVALVGLQTTAAGIGGDARCAVVLTNIASLAATQGRHREAAAMRAVSDNWRSVGLRAETTQMLRHKAVDEVETAMGGVFDMAAAPHGASSDKPVDSAAAGGAT